MNNKDAREQITQAISQSKFRWRTPRGIAKDVGLSVPQVMEVLERSDQFVRARKGNARGEPLYSTREKSQSTLSQRILSALTNERAE
jgi:hypothetical protein